MIGPIDIRSDVVDSPNAVSTTIHRASAATVISNGEHFHCI